MLLQVARTVVVAVGVGAMTPDEPIMARTVWRHVTAEDAADAPALAAMQRDLLHPDRPRVRYAPGVAPDTSPPTRIGDLVGVPNVDLPPVSAEVDALVRAATQAFDDQLADRIRAAFPSDADEGLTPVELIQRARELYGLTAEIEYEPIRFTPERVDWRAESWRIAFEQKARLRFRRRAGRPAGVADDHRRVAQTVSASAASRADRAASCCAARSAARRCSGSGRWWRAIRAA